MKQITIQIDEVENGFLIGVTDKEGKKVFHIVEDTDSQAIPINDKVTAKIYGIMKQFLKKLRTETAQRKK